METNITHADGLLDTFRESIIPGKFVRIEYLTDINEFIKIDALVKKLNADTIELGTGEEVPIDRIIRIGGVMSPKFPGYESYSCDC